MDKLKTIVITAAVALPIGYLAAGPMKGHPNLQAADKALATAWEKITAPQKANEFDLALGTPNLHTVRRKVQWTERPTLLPPELFERFTGDAFWAVPGLNIRNVPVILPTA